MNTPPTGVSNSTTVTDHLAENLCKRLEEVAESRTRATPEPQFEDDVETCHQWRCEVLLNHFKPNEADKQRMRIFQRDYWKVECLHYMDMFGELMWQKVRAAHGENGEPTADHWRALTMSYQKLLEYSGLSLPEIRKSRLSIRDQKYWQLEADVYEQCVAQSEHEMREALRKKDEAQHPRRARNKQPAAGRSRRVQRPQATNQASPSGGIASRTRSRTITGVAKRELRRR
ncbi:hypothetical protein J3458_015211 [Metarhizium acridum]|uniref:uncharacterized protein n=1 Tax=Metarhizium acridum TaxID=92637 RepID=UPI001C6BF8FE|nr:hypothetical protein J3458_015211 [Metarhizium acridum]